MTKNKLRILLAVCSKFVSKFVLICGLICVFIYVSVQGSMAYADSVKVLSQRTERHLSGKPGEPAIVFQETKKKVTLSGVPKNQANYMTDLRFAYNTGDAKTIETFAIVQWIRGCMFHAVANQGQVSKTLSISREHFGKTVPFQHRDWEIDTDSDDPIYTNYESMGRHALLRWNVKPDSLDAETSKYYGQAKPPHGTVFATDLPGSGFLTGGSGKLNGSSQNTSLEFRTCLFRTTDLPLITTPRGENIDSSKALLCQTWDHKFIWNFIKGKMTSPDQLDSVCEMK